MPRYSLVRALAHFLIDYGPEHDLMWVCFQDDSGEVLIGEE